MTRNIFGPDSVIGGSPEMDSGLGVCLKTCPLGSNPLGHISAGKPHWWTQGTCVHTRSQTLGDNRTVGFTKVQLILGQGSHCIAGLSRLPGWRCCGVRVRG